jgi:hypothetical protein
VQVFGRWNAETIRALWQPASEKRQGRKSRSVVQRRCGGRYGDFAAACWLRKFDEIGRFAWFSLEHEWARSGDGSNRILREKLCPPVCDPPHSRCGPVGVKVARSHRTRRTKRATAFPYHPCTAGRAGALPTERAALLSKATDEARAERQRPLDDARKAADALSAKRTFNEFTPGNIEGPELARDHNVPLKGSRALRSEDAPIPGVPASQSAGSPATV